MIINVSFWPNLLQLWTLVQKYEIKVNELVFNLRVWAVILAIEPWVFLSVSIPCTVNSNFWLALILLKLIADFGVVSALSPSRFKYRYLTIYFSNRASGSHLKYILFDSTRVIRKFRIHETEQKKYYRICIKYYWRRHCTSWRNHSKDIKKHF